MKVWPKRYGSPFDQGGYKYNMRFYFKYNFTKGKQPYHWKMPRKLPKL